MKKLLNDDATYKIIGCAMRVHSKLGCGFQERIHQKALAMEMKKVDLKYHREMEMDLVYDGMKIGTRRVDFFVEDRIMLEFKAVIKLEDVHLSQAINYCEASSLPVGLLINFGSKSLEYKRVINTTHPENIPKSNNPSI